MPRDRTTHTKMTAPMNATTMLPTKPAWPWMPKRRITIPPMKAPEEAQDDVPKGAVAGSLHHLAGEPAGDQPDDDPRDDPTRLKHHDTCPFSGQKW